MNPLEGARCVGKAKLFESTDLLDHREAAAICAECPARLACLRLLHEERHTPLSSPSGTWAGQLVGTARKPLDRPREHGTERGYYQHKNRKETACAACREALRVATNKRRKATAS